VYDVNVSVKMNLNLPDMFSLHIL